MDQNIQRLIKAKSKWESDIKMYKEFLKSETQTFEGRYSAKEYISMAENKLNDINQKLKGFKHK